MTPTPPYVDATAPARFSDTLWAYLAVRTADGDGATVDQLLADFDDPLVDRERVASCLGSLMAHGRVEADPDSLGPERETVYHAVPEPPPTSDPTFTEALDHLADSLPENPELDTEHQRALRVVVGECESLPVGLPWEERLDPEWFAREGDVEDTLRTARSVLARVHHPDTGMYGLLSALVLNLERAGAIVRELAEDCGPPLHHEYGDCAWCEDNYDDLTGKAAAAHDDTCTWRMACEWAAAHPVKTDAIKAGWESARRQALTEETPAP